MPSERIRVRALHIAAFGLLACSSAAWASEPEVQLQLSTIFTGPLAIGSAVPIIVLAKNTCSRAVRGSLEVTGGPEMLPIRQTLVLGPGEARAIEVTVVLHGAIEASFGVGRTRALARLENMSFGASTTLWIGESSDLALLEAVGGIAANPQAPISRARSEHSHVLLPKTAEGYSAFLFVVADPAMLASITEAQRAALVDWVRLGGRLVLVPSGRAVGAVFDEAFARAMLIETLGAAGLRRIGGFAQVQGGIAARLGMGSVGVFFRDTPEFGATIAGVAKWWPLRAGATPELGRDWHQRTLAFRALDPVDRRQRLLAVTLVLALTLCVLGPLALRRAEVQAHPLRALALITATSCLMLIGLFVWLAWAFGPTPRVRRLEIQSFVDGAEGGISDRLAAISSDGTPLSYEVEPDRILRTLGPVPLGASFIDIDGGHAILRGLGLYPRDLLPFVERTPIDGALRWVVGAHDALELANDTRTKVRCAIMRDERLRLYATGPVAPGARAAFAPLSTVETTHALEAMPCATPLETRALRAWPNDDTSGANRTIWALLEAEDRTSTLSLSDAIDLDIVVAILRQE